MKKIIVTLSFIFTFAMYSLYQFLGMTGTVAYVSNTAPASNTTPVSTTSSVSHPAITTKKTLASASSNQATAQTQSSAQSTPAARLPPAPAVQKSMYADGTYTGSVADAYYGNIQVEAVIQNGKIIDVQFLQYPNDRSTSIYKNQMAMPILKSEAIATQSANVDIVSGATDSSQAFQQSLGSALAQAANS